LVERLAVHLVENLVERLAVHLVEKLAAQMVALKAEL
jgi:hypothetical protein